MIDYKMIFLIIGIILTFTGFYHYIRDTIIGKTKPHIFSWLIWAILTFIAFFAQLSDNAGFGAWLTALSSTLCILIVVLSIKNGEKDISKSDIFSFLGAIIAIVIWYITDYALYSILLVTIIDALGFYPTFRKSYFKPFEETLSSYILATIKFIFAIMALSHFTLITYLFPLSLFIMNGLFVIMIIIRRKQLSIKF